MDSIKRDFKILTGETDNDMVSLFVSNASKRDSTTPFGVCTSASMNVPVLTLRIRTRVTGEVAAIKPFSMANAPTPDSILPQLGVVSTRCS